MLINKLNRFILHFIITFYYYILLLHFIITLLHKSTFKNIK